MSDDLTRVQTRLDFGLKGFDVVGSGANVDASTHEDGYYAVVARGGNAQVDLTSAIGDSASNVALLQGEIALGYFSKVEVDSGTVWAYRR